MQQQTEIKQVLCTSGQKQNDKSKEALLLQTLLLNRTFCGTLEWPQIF